VFLIADLVGRTVESRLQQHPLKWLI